MIILHGLKTCDTCRKALKALSEAGTPAQLRDLRDPAVTRAEVAGWAANLGERLLNTRSTTWRSLSQEARSGDPVALITAHPALIKRPVVETDGTVLLGWTPETRAALGLEG